MEIALLTGQNHEKLVGVVNRTDSLFDCEVKHMPAGFAVGGQEVKVIAGDIDPTYILGTPETKCCNLRCTLPFKVSKSDVRGDPPPKGVCPIKG